MIADLIKRLGGKETVASRLGITQNALCKWGTEAVPGIPSKHWAALRKLSGNTVTFEELAAARAPTSRRRAA